MAAELVQTDEEVKVGNQHTVKWIVWWDWPPNINMQTAGMVTQLTLKYWYTKKGEPDTEKRIITLRTSTYNGTMNERIHSGLWEGVPWDMGQIAPPLGGGWTMNLKYSIVSVLDWYEGLTRHVMTDSWNSGVYLHAM